MKDEDAAAISVLRELFPDLYPERLLSVLQMYGGDVEMASDHLFSSQAECTGYQLNSLFEMFPDVGDSVVRRHYEDAGRDVERATEALLGFQMAKQLQEQLSLEEKQEEEKHKKARSNNKLKWSSLSDKIETLARFSGLSEKEATMYFHKNSGDVCEALVDIVLHHQENNFSEDDEEEIHQLKTTTIRATPKFLDHIGSGSGRVQNGPYNVKEVPLYSLTLKEKAQLEKQKNRKDKKENETRSKRSNSTSSSTSSRTSSSSEGSTNTDLTEYPDDSKPYRFHDTNPEVEELANTVFNNESLVDISWNFYKHAITLFKGDIAKVIELAIFLLENDAASMTYKDMNKALDYSQLFAHVRSSTPPPSRTTRAGASSYASIASENSGNFTEVVKRRVQSFPVGPDADTEVGLDKDQIILQRNALKTALRSNILDLHGFHVANGKITASKALCQWWDDELQAREVDGRNTNSTKVYMTSPLMIITGRGIHSDAGKSKLRHAIKTMLEKGPFKFEEESSRFIVVGRKIGR